MLPYGAMARPAIKVRAVTVGALGDQIGLPEFPSNDPLVHVLLGEGKPKAATCSVTDVKPAFTVDLGFIRERILILVAFHEHDAEAFLLKLRSEPFAHGFLALVQFLNCDETLIV
jgi:hypothetical protein